ncbi:conjugative transposon protein TraJ [Sphingobacterium sp. DK4209]|uniref:Conjugative transposon protein TraJ n=1 Tax=Sphingobacterium zhuxiongii TaxID=2662364 RepID=A0A5Q0QJG1_9SPHI|nr:MULTISPECIES: conjugative transposon protein TraJ [unclassified Sphingobacterium]MVZ65721.1 conjugative transposon protein TraJ [Sphingobacterium sp. DK4209]QGA27920.1 conjugative transposon protein TraJ [Sphingobacterium sp. dk4302]
MINRIICIFIFLLPRFLFAQGSGQEIASLQQVLDQLYQQMLPLCRGLIGVAQSIAGFAALWYIGSRVWRHIARAEPIDFYPLFRPFVLGFCILFFPAIVALINAIMQPTVEVTRNMVGNSNKAIQELLIIKENQLKKTDAWQLYVGQDGQGDRDRWYTYTYDESASGEGMLEGVGNDLRFAMAKASYNFRNSIKEWLSELLQILFESAALCINTLRTFQLIVLAILGPLALGLSVFDGFTHLLQNWIARYLHVFLWLPVANIFGSIIARIQENMLKVDLAQLEATGDTFFSRIDIAYLIFLIIGIVGYFTVPTVAGYIVSVGAGSDSFGRQTNTVFHSAATTGGAAVGGLVGVAFSGMNRASPEILDANSRSAASDRSPHQTNQNNSSYMKDQIKGDT